MASLFNTIDRILQRLSPMPLFAIAGICLLIVCGVDYLTGYEVSFSLFYLGPVALAAWYVGGTSGVIMAALSCLSWYLADRASNPFYSHPLIPIWNALVRFGFFLITAFLLGALRTSYRKQQDLARTDALTGLCIRREFEARLKHEIALSQRRKDRLTLAFVDLDNFKGVNATHGHQGGDRALRVLGNVLQASIRETDLASRLGGDEFGLLLPDTDGPGAEKIISRLNANLREDPLLKAWGVTCSVGVATFFAGLQSPEQMIAAADQMMFEVKRNGKGSFAFQSFPSGEGETQ